MDPVQVQLLMTELYTAHSAYMTKLAKKEKIGNVSTKFKFKGFILSAMLEILIDYLSPSAVDDNFFTKLEIEDVLQHFNNIANTNIYSTLIND